MTPRTPQGKPSGNEAQNTAQIRPKIGPETRPFRLKTGWKPLLCLARPCLAAINHGAYCSPICEPASTELRGFAMRRCKKPVLKFS